MPFGIGRRCLFVALCAVVAAGCSGGLLKPEYEYEEHLSIALDGSATLNLSASVPALVALHGIDLPVDPREFLDRQKLRALFERAGADVRMSLSRRDGRRFVHVTVEVDDVRQLARNPPFDWSAYRMQRRDEVIEFSQVIGPSAGGHVGDAGWDGTELVAFRLQLPSKILGHNSTGEIQRGNILEWEQRLADRVKGEPLALQAQIATESILRTTLLLFGATIVAAAAAFATVIWWFARRAPGAEMVKSHP